eukprot:1724240-Alexandrium_andersonii.AAC.1
MSHPKLRDPPNDDDDDDDDSFILVHSSPTPVHVRHGMPGCSAEQVRNLHDGREGLLEQGKAAQLN